ncbi:MAG: Ni/Fe-hydrogenase cytochrome b subunit [Deltaproteobacteria bacterium]|nr:MAG: Ni/Fe-hydrogenase cytochrome b subunit [Deltaproteobacteria bacterium]
MSEAKPVGGKIFTGPFLFFLVITLIGTYFLAKRFMFGIGAVSNMNDGFPWGIWITYDVVVGTAFACGGYSMALLVYAFNNGEYHPLVRPALLASMFGYTLAGVSVFIDIGRYWHIYNVFLPWFTNFNSILLEVALCIALYIAVLWIEFSPTFVEAKTNTKSKVNKVMVFFIALGILLPTMHQSSLGSLMILAGSKLSQLWWTPALPLIFLISAITMGYTVVIFESTLSALGFKRPLETDIIGKLSLVIPVLLAILLVVRFGDLLIRGQIGLAFAGDLQGNMFLLENILHIIPLVILASASNRKSAKMLFLSACSLMLGGLIFRFNTYLVGFNPGEGWHYFPAVGEQFITYAIISAEILLYMIFVKKLPVLPSHGEAEA